MPGEASPTGQGCDTHSCLNSGRYLCARLCTAMHTHSGFARPEQRSRAAFSTVPVGNQIADYERLGARSLAPAGVCITSSSATLSGRERAPSLSRACVTYRHFAGRDELLAAISAAAMRELAADVGRVRGTYGDPAAARRRPRAIGRAYLEFARQEPGLFATAFVVPRQHSYDAPDGGTGQDPLPLDQLRAVLDELADAGVLSRQRRAGLEYPIWSTVHGLAVLTGQGPLRELPDATRGHLEKLTSAFIGEALA